MAKRRLTRQQSRRIKDNLDARQQLDDTEGQTTSGMRQTGLIISHHGKLLLVEDSNGNRIRCSSRQNIGQPVCGDHVIWETINGQEGVITAIKDRSSLLVRPGYGKRIKPVAANITLICIVIAPEPEPQETLIDRYLVAAEHLNIKPVIINNKCDLLSAVELDEWHSRFSVYTDIGYEIISTSTRLDQGINDLREALKGNVSILVGQSGVGKSSLINSLIPDIQVRVSELSSQIAKGQHTTSHSELYHLPGDGGDLIDSPGVRDFQLGHLDRRAVEQGFIDFRPFLGKCRFSDCRHIDEPDCAILAAVASRHIDAHRLDSYHTIVD
jgi:ribosome biogenesis GTPase